MNNSRNFRNPRETQARAVGHIEQRPSYTPGVLGIALTVLGQACIFWIALWVLRDAGAIDFTVTWWKLNALAAATVAFKFWWTVITRH